MTQPFDFGLIVTLLIFLANGLYYVRTFTLFNIDVILCYILFYFIQIFPAKIKKIFKNNRKKISCTFVLLQYPRKNITLRIL